MEIHDGTGDGACGKCRPGSRSPVEGVFAAAISALALGVSGLLFAESAAAQERCLTAPAAAIDWRDCNKSNIVLQGGDLEGADLVGTDFSATDLREANLDAANLEGATLVRTSLAGASANKADFSKVEAYRSSFAGISAEGTSFAGAELQRSDFSQARLAGADFEKAELGRANFDKAVLTGTRFPLANLARADLSGAIFEGPLEFGRAFMFLTRIEGLDLSAASGLEQAQVDIACGDAETKLPAGLSKPANWPCAFD